MIFRMEGFDELKRNLDNLVKNPQQLLVGHSAAIQKEVECKTCGEKFIITIPVKIQEVVGKGGYGPGYTTKQECPECGELGTYHWDKTIANIQLT